MNATLAPASGLTTLVQEIASGNRATVVASWTLWYEQALDQLESDDAFDAHTTDLLAESLENIDAALAGEQSVELAFGNLLSLYRTRQQSVESRWRQKAAGLGRVQLETELWSDLNRALEAASLGKKDLVAHWLETTRSTFEDAWQNYRNADILLFEVTEESQAGHRLLGEGIAHWCDALELFRTGLASSIDRGTVLAKAEAGQRLLVGLQVIEQEHEDCVDRFAHAWAN